MLEEESPVAVWTFESLLQVSDDDTAVLYTYMYVAYEPVSVPIFL
jgi:hypothetical protein